MIDHCVTVKLVLLVAVPPGVVTVILPVIAFGGTVAAICVLVSTVNAEVTPPKVTLVAPVKVVPLMITSVPTLPLVGVKLVILGATVNVAELVADPPAVVTEIFPVFAAAGTVAVT